MSAFTFAELLGLAPKPIQTTVKAVPAKITTAASRSPLGSMQNHHDPRVAAMYRRLGKAKAVTAPSAPAAKAAAVGKLPQAVSAFAQNAASMAARSRKPVAGPRPAASKPANALSFAHLMPAPANYEDDAEISALSAKAFATQVHAAANKARTGIGMTVPKPTGVAAQILAAGQKARTLTKDSPLPTDPVVRGIILAGRKRRGEI